jgi:hypothetical protein
MKTRAEVLDHLKHHFKPALPGQEVSVDFFKPEDAMGVVSTCFAVYGEGYPVDTYYLPERLIDENAKGNIHSIVAKNEENEVIGHGALFHSSSPFEGMYEVGQYIIQKAYRGSGAVQEIHRYVTELCPEKYKIAALYGEPVTNHTIIQNMMQAKGFVETGLEIDLMPAQAYEADSSIQGRVSTLLTFSIPKDCPHILYPPLPYADQIQADIAQLSLDREISAPRTEEPVQEKSQTLREFYDFAGVGRLQVQNLGQDIAQVIQAFEDEIKKRDFQVTQLFLPLDQPQIHDICTRLNEKKYFYGGYLPRWFATDGILMQKIVPQPCFEGLKLYTEKAKKLLDYVKNDWERIS